LFTLLFTVEYVLRLLTVRRPLRYATSFLGLVDLLAVLPTYLSLLLPGTQSLLVIRALRLLRIFRVFKIARYLHEVSALVRAIRNSSAKIAVFLLAVLAIVLIMGAAMYVIEGEQSGFTSIPRGMYWAIVTVTTVGYGDIAPRTIVGQIVASIAMVLGYSLIIIPTGIFSMEIVQAARQQVTTQACPECLAEGHDVDAKYCKRCGARL
jgi:voltage-gated potassium channel